MENNQEENETENVSKSFFSNLSLRGQPKFSPKKLKDLNTEELNKQVSELVEASEGWDSWNWEFVQEDKGVTITRTAIPNSPLKCTKGVTIFKAAPRDVLDIVTNINSYKKWDDKILDSKLVTAINSHTSTNYIEFAPSFPVTGRDFSFLQYIHRQSDGTYVVSWHSIKDDSIPKKKGVVRAAMGNSGFIITPIKPYEPSQPMRSLVTFVVQFDYKGKTTLDKRFKIKGWIPHNVMNQITASQPMILYFVGEELERLKEMNMTRKFSIYASKPPSFDSINNATIASNFDAMIPTNPPPEPPSKQGESKKEESKENQQN